MATLTKLIVSIILSILLSSCEFNTNFSTGVRGNGNVVTTERTISSDFDEIIISRGIEVYVTQSTNTSLTVEADENLHEIIITKVNGNTLEIYADKNIGSSNSQKVFLSFKDVSKISSNSGGSVTSTNVINTENLNLHTTSGARMELEVNTNALHCETTSGSHISVSGKTNSLNADATSGSVIDAEDLTAITSKAYASSGANITVKTKKELIAKASSGGDITYYGNPEKVNKKDGVSGSIKKR